MLLAGERLLCVAVATDLLPRIRGNFCRRLSTSYPCRLKRASMFKHFKSVTPKKNGWVWLTDGPENEKEWC